MESTKFHTESYTKMRVNHFSHTWSIDNFTFYTVDGNVWPYSASTSSSSVQTTSQFPFLLSQKFSSEDSLFRFYLSVYPRGDSEQMKDSVSIYLHLDSPVQTEHDVLYEISIIDSKNKKFGTHMARSKFKTNGCWGFRSIIKRNYLVENANRFLPEGKLSINCEVKVVLEITTESVQTYNFERLQQLAEKRSISDYAVMFREGKFTDMVFEVGGREFHAHKAILAARSAVFAAMFEHDTMEKAENRVVICDFDADIFEAALKFIYSGDASILNEFGAELLLLADKYDLESLKAVCIDSLSMSLNVENVADILYYSDMCNVTYLREKAMEFIVSNTFAVMSSPNWSVVSRQVPTLVNEILFQVALKNQPPRQIDFPYISNESVKIPLPSTSSSHNSALADAAANTRNNTLPQHVQRQIPGPMPQLIRIMPQAEPAHSIQQPSTNKRIRI